jgi:hypothetical protein
MKTLGSASIAPPFLTAAVDGSEWSASRPCRFTAGTHWIGGWVGPRTGLDVVEKRKSCPCLDSNPDRPAHSLSLYRLSYPDSSCIIIHVHFMLPSISSRLWLTPWSRVFLGNLIVAQLVKKLYDLRFSQRWLWRVSSSGMWLHVVCWDATDVSEEHIASIFRDEENFSLPPAYLLVLLKLFLRPWRWRRYVPPKRRLHLNRLHGVTSQKMILFGQEILRIL